MISQIQNRFIISQMQIDSSLIVEFIWFFFTRIVVYFGLPYFIYTRFVDPFLSYRHYSKQKLGIFGVPLPIIGNGLLIQKALIEGLRVRSFKNAFVTLVEEYFGGVSYVGAFVVWLGHQPGIGICDPKIVEDLYNSKNIYFDKHPIIKNITKKLTGSSILFDETSKNQKARRQAISPAFYSGKLKEMVQLSSGAVEKFIRDLEKRINSQGTGQIQIDIIEEVSQLTTNVLLTCVLGNDLSEKRINYWKDGIQTQKKVSFALRDVFQEMIMRYQALHVALFPIFADIYITPHERGIKANGLAVRAIVQEVLNNRRKASKLNEGDLLSLMLNDPMFMDNDELIIDELLTIFFAGSQTTANATQNLILHLLNHPKYEKDILNQLETKIVQPYRENRKATEKIPCRYGNKDSILDMYTYDGIKELDVYQNCFNESLRIQPPVYYSSTVRMTQDVVAGGVHIRKGDQMWIGMSHLCNNPQEWQQPNQFIPERFDNSNPISLTPSGKKRNPYSFSPYLGGVRICLGKTFVEQVSKVMLPSILYHFEFSHLEENKGKFEMPHNNMICRYVPQVFLNIKARIS